MDFTLSFVTRVALAVAVAWVWFSLPGWLAARAADLPEECRLLVAPLIGAAVVGTTSCLLFHLIPYRRLTLALVWVLCVAGLWWWARRRGASSPPPRRAWLLLAACLPLGAIASADITPVVHDGALYVGGAIHDHEKIAIVDAIAREGLPPSSPYYHPGRSVPLNYYYLWHFLASQLKLVTGLSGWEADAALTWFTLSAVVATLVGMVLALGGSTLGALFAMALPLCGGLQNALVLIASRAPDSPWVRAVEPYLAVRSGFQTLIVNAAWAPHHVFAAGVIVLALFLLAQVLTSSEDVVSRALLLGALTAATFGASLWLSFGLAAAAPVIAICLLFTARRHGIGVTAPSARALLVAAAVAVVLAAPILFSELRGDAGGAGGLPIALHAPALVRGAPVWVNFVGWWLLGVTGVFGIALMFGVAGMVLYRPATRPELLFRAAAFAAAPVFLLVSQLVAATLSADDVGLRVPLPAFTLLVVFAGVMVSMLAGRSKARCASALARAPAWSRIGLLVTGLAGLALGLYAGPFRLTWRIYAQREPPPAEEAAQSDLRRDLLEQRRAWEIVRRLSPPDAVVQSNPDGYAKVTPWPINLPFVLFADRAAVIGSADSAQTFAARSSQKERELVAAIVDAAFDGRPDPRIYRALRELGVDVLVVDRRDALFATAYLDAAADWRLAHSDRTFRIYVAVPHPKTSDPATAPLPAAPRPTIQ